MLPDELNRIFRYNTDSINTMLAELQKPEHNQHRWGDDQPLNGIRGPLADALEENDRTKEAELLRTPNQHVMVVDGKVRPAKFNWRRVSQQLNHLSEVGSRVYGGDTNDQFYGLYHDEHPSDPSKHLVWIHNNPSSGPADVVPLNELGNVFADDAERDLLRNRSSHHPDVEKALNDLRTAPYEEVNRDHSSERDNGFGLDDPNVRKY